MVALQCHVYDSIVYFSLTIHDQKKMIKSQKIKTTGAIVNFQIKEEHVIENIVVGQMIVEVDIIVKLNLNINVKIKYETRVIQNMCHGAFVNGWVLNFANFPKTRTFCQLLLTLCFNDFF